MRSLLACLTIITVAGACSPKAEPLSVTVSPSPTIINQRVSVVDVPSDFDGVWLEFATVKHGYAMFTKHSPQATEARLFSTDDGGLSWTARPHPKPIAKDQGLYVMDADSVALHTDMGTWYTSHDGMASWQPGGRAGHALGKGPFYVDCALEQDACVLRSHDAGPDWRRAVPARFEHGTLTNLGNGRYWLASVYAGAAITHLDGRDVKVPAQQGRNVLRAQVMVSQDGADTWLIAEQEPAELASGRTGVVLKATGLPLIWRLRDGAWVAVPTNSIEEKPTWQYPVAPAGGGLLLIAGPDGLMFFDGRPTDGRPAMIKDLPRFDWVGQTWDGTIFGRPSADQNAIYLSTGTASAREWIKVGLSRR